MTKIQPFGTWKSPITAAVVASQARQLMSILIDGNDIYWIETRPEEDGRNTIVRWTPGIGISECTGPDYSVRSTVHEYGGGPFTVADAVVYFVNSSDQRLYRQATKDAPRLLTPESRYRYADLILDRENGRLICVREDHTRGGEPLNAIVDVELDGADGGRVLIGGNDFYASARLSPDGTKLAYLTWNHPNMPWDGCELRVASLRPDGTLSASQLVAGGAAESIFQPEWSPDGVLHFVSDRGGWWNLYRWEPEGYGIRALCPMEAEFGRPQWVFGLSTYAFVSASRIICCYARDGVHHLASLDTSMGSLTRIPGPYTEISYVRAGRGFAAFVGSSPSTPASIVRLDMQDDALEVLGRSAGAGLDAGYLSNPEATSFPTGNYQQAYGLYYAPKNRDYEAPAGERPPLIVLTHGGPTSAAETSRNLSIQYWTSRGFAVLHVNYGGSTGYGRRYRERLNGQWGIVDVDDCCNGALYLADRGLVDRARLAIHGTSAGGYTALGSLAFRSGVFRVGASYYGISDLERLASGSHKFESRYLDLLIGPYPESKDLYLERSPINSVSKITSPLILFQGDEDAVASPAHSEVMFEALRARGVPVAYLLFRGEGHRFRRADTLKRALEAELYFYSRILGFSPADTIEPVSIENL